MPEWYGGTCATDYSVSLYRCSLCRITLQYKVQSRTSCTLSRFVLQHVVIHIFEWEKYQLPRRRPYLEYDIVSKAQCAMHCMHFSANPSLTTSYVRVGVPTCHTPTQEESNHPPLTWPLTVWTHSSIILECWVNNGSLKVAQIVFHTAIIV